MYYLKQGDLSDFQPGSVTSTFHRCGNSGCHCPKPDDPGHGPHFQITGKIDGKTVTQSLPPLTPVQEDLPFAACRAGGTNAAGKKRAEETQCQVTEEGDRFLSLKWQPSGSYHVLATAYDDHALYDEKASDASNKQPMPGPGINEPMLWTTQYGNGRV